MKSFGNVQLVQSLMHTPSTFTEVGLDQNWWGPETKKNTKNLINFPLPGPMINDNLVSVLSAYVGIPFIRLMEAF